MANVDQLASLPASGIKRLRELLPKALQSGRADTGVILQKLIGGVITEHTERDDGPLPAYRASDFVKLYETKGLTRRSTRKLLEFEKTLSAKQDLTHEQYVQALERYAGTLKTLQREH